VDVSQRALARTIWPHDRMTSPADTVKLQALNVYHIANAVKLLDRFIFFVDVFVEAELVLESTTTDTRIALVPLIT
jgi:hypothetical protein